MVMQSWPSSLPTLPEKVYSVKPILGISSEEDELSQSRTVTYQWYRGSFLFKQLTIQQFQLLREFYNDTLNHVKPFLAPWLTHCGFGFHCCKFESEPSFSMSGNKMDANVSILIIPLVPVDDEGNITYGETI